mgnify:CR=1 FL=1
MLFLINEFWKSVILMYMLLKWTSFIVISINLIILQSHFTGVVYVNVKKNNIMVHSDVPVMKSCKSNSLKKD